MFIYDTAKKERYYEEVVAMYRETGYSSYRLAKLFPLSKHTLERWIANFVAINPQAEPSVMARKSKKEEQTRSNVPVNEALPDDVLALQKEIKQLRAQLTKAEIKAEAFDELINVAEAQFGIQIRKKAGAKQ